MNFHKFIFKSVHLSSYHSDILFLKAFIPYSLSLIILLTPTYGLSNCFSSCRKFLWWYYFFFSTWWFSLVVFASFVIFLEICDSSFGFLFHFWYLVTSCLITSTLRKSALVCIIFPLQPILNYWSGVLKEGGGKRCVQSGFVSWL